MQVGGYPINISNYKASSTEINRLKARTYSYDKILDAYTENLKE